MRRSPYSLLLATAVMLASFPLRADGVDMEAYLTRVGRHSVPVTLCLLLLLFTINYGLNFLVIGLPAIKFSNHPKRSITFELVWLTLLGQLADRLGAILSGFGAVPIAMGLNLKGEGAWVLPLIGLNFVLSGIAVFGLVLFFLRRRWSIRGRRSVFIALSAGIITNPAWVMATWFL